MNVLARKTIIRATINFGEGKKLETSFHDTAIFPFIAPMRDLKNKKKKPIGQQVWFPTSRLSNIKQEKGMTIILLECSTI